MNRVFARILAGILVALLGYTVFAWILFSGLNSVRLQQFNEDLAEPLVYWLRESPKTHSQVLGSLSLGDGFLFRHEVPQVLLSRLDRDRLSAGQVVFHPDADDWAVLAQLEDSERLLELRWARPVEQSALWLGQVITKELSALNETSQSARLGYWGSLSGYSLDLVSYPALEELGGLQRAALASRGWVLLTNVNGSPESLWFALNDNQWLIISDLPLFNPWSWGITLSLVISGLVFLAAALFLLLETLDRRLRKLETMATRIARGELDARVDEGRFDLLERLSRVFNQMAEHIQRLVGVQREMIHAVSHELRTPVARIRFGVQMIEDFSDPDMRAKQIKGIDHDIQELNELIDEILTYARLEQGGPILDFQEVNLCDLVQQVVEEQQRIKPDRVVDCTFLGESRKWSSSEAEPRYIHRAVQNLVGNALRYAASQVRVVCSFGDETCRIDVEDDGPGIPESDWEKVFTPFARLDDSRTRSSGGYGLGLSIVRRILFWHGGQAFVTRSADLGGAKFSLVWPRQHSRETD